MASRRTVRRVQVRRDAAVDAQVRGAVTGGRTGRWAVGPSPPAARRVRAYVAVMRCEAMHSASRRQRGAGASGNQVDENAAASKRGRGTVVDAGVYRGARRRRRWRGRWNFRFAD